LKKSYECKDSAIECIVTALQRGEEKEGSSRRKRERECMANMDMQEEEREEVYGQRRQEYFN